MVSDDRIVLQMSQDFHFSLDAIIVPRAGEPIDVDRLDGVRFAIQQIPRFDNASKSASSQLLDFYEFFLVARWQLRSGKTLARSVEFPVIILVVVTRDIFR